MYISRLLNSSYSSIIISAIIGFGLATLFRENCKNGNCHVFKAPQELKNQDIVYEINGDCYRPIATPETCNSQKKIIEFFK